MSLTKLVDMLRQTAAKVRSLVLRDNVLATKTLKEAADLVVGCLCLCLVGHLAHAAHCVSRCLCPVTVLKSSLLRLANSF